MFDIITVGSATVDVFAKTESGLIKIKTTKEEEEFIAYPSGTKILISSLSFETGGGGTNTAVAFSRLGLNTAFLGKLGNDENSKRILELLKKEDVEFIGTRGKLPTGYSVILDSIEDDRTILTYKGSNSDLKFSEIKKELLRAKWFYFSSMVGKSFSCLEKLADYAARNNIKIAFNPSSYLAEKGSIFIKSILTRTEILVLNKEEAFDLVGKNPIEDTIKNLTILGPKIAIITDGKNGAYAYDRETFYYMPANKLKVKETTGAGDAFASGFVAGYILKRDICFALNIGMANASSVVKYIGAKNKLLTLKEALSEKKKNKRIIKKKLDLRS